MIYPSCGLFHAPFFEAGKLFPEARDVLGDCPIDAEREYVVDVKVYMLMPGQWPCIPGWHRDFVPRDDGLNLRPDQITPEEVMFLWLSGPPLTEFKDGRPVDPGTWVPFTQEDWHRGVASDRHTWRTFIRVAPTTLLDPAEPEKWIRRHTQVYLDAEAFTW